MAVIIRSACIGDIPHIEKILSQYLLETKLVKSHIDQFIVAEYINRKKKIVGCACLDISAKVLELRSIAVLPGWKNKRIGRRLFEILQTKARSIGDRLYVRTTAVDFFKKMGFTAIDNSQKPVIWQDCACCDKLNVCRQVPMVLELR
jgi:amino-acid N-acetyltransferase